MWGGPSTSELYMWLTGLGPVQSRDDVLALAAVRFPLHSELEQELLKQRLVGLMEGLRLMAVDSLAALHRGSFVDFAQGLGRLG